MNIKVLFYFMLLTGTFFSANAQKRITVIPAELKNLSGCWKGTLNYSGTMIRKPHSADADLSIKRIGKTKTFELIHRYSPDSSDKTYDTLHISSNSRKVEGASIISKKIKKNGTLTIITETKGFDHDNNQQALIRKTYTICKRKYTYTKKLKFSGQSQWTDREAFTYTRIACK